MLPSAQTSSAGKAVASDSDDVDLFASDDEPAPKPKLVKPQPRQQQPPAAAGGELSKKAAKKAAKQEKKAAAKAAAAAPVYDDEMEVCCRWPIHACTNRPLPLHYELVRTVSPYPPQQIDRDGVPSLILLTHRI